jgi:hypothetical protein
MHSFIIRRLHTPPLFRPQISTARLPHSISHLPSLITHCPITTHIHPSTVKIQSALACCSVPDLRQKQRGQPIDLPFHTHPCTSNPALSPLSEASPPGPDLIISFHTSPSTGLLSGSRPHFFLPPSASTSIRSLLYPFDN